MDWLKDTLVFETRGKGMYLITNDIQMLLTEWKVQEGQCTLFVPHTSASLALSECYDPDARLDVRSFLNALHPKIRPGIAIRWRAGMIPPRTCVR